MPGRRTAKKQVAPGALTAPKLVELQEADILDELTIVEPAPPKKKKKGKGKGARATQEGEDEEGEVVRAIVTTNCCITYVNPEVALNAKAWRDRDKFLLGAVDAIHTDEDDHPWLVVRKLLSKKLATQGPTSPHVPAASMDSREVLITNQIFVLDFSRVVDTSLVTVIWPLGWQVPPLEKGSLWTRFYWKSDLTYLLSYGSTVGNPTAASRYLGSCCNEIYQPHRDAQVFCEECNRWFHTGCLYEKPEFRRRIPELVDDNYAALSGAVLLHYLTTNLPIVRGKHLRWPRWKVGGIGEWVNQAREYESETRRPNKADIIGLIPNDDLAHEDVFMTCANLPFYECRICETKL